MVIQALFFGATADAAGIRSTKLDIDGEVTAAKVMDRILSDHPNLTRHKLHLAVNQEYVTGDVLLGDGDEVAVFTAVSGG